MKITGPNGISTTGAGQAARRAAGAGFALPTGEAPASASGMTGALGVSSVGSLDALIALQQVDEPGERRRRAVHRGGRLLDLLERLKLSLLGGEAGEQDLVELQAAIREQRALTGDPGLEALLDQIETRAAVELAKRETRASQR
jgi:hypothetical protein